MNTILETYKSTDAKCSFLNCFSDSTLPVSPKSRILFILGDRKYVFIKKLIAMPIPTTIPKKNSASAKIKNIMSRLKNRS